MKPLAVIQGIFYMLFRSITNYLYRFTKPQILLLLQYFDFEVIEWRNRQRPSPELALCLVLVQQSYPHRFFELSFLFGRSLAWLSSVYTDAIIHLTMRYKPILEWHPTIDYRRIREYGRALNDAGGGGLIWGFIDGTFQGVCRPTEEQRDYYSGYKKRHGVKYQGIVCPDGLIGSIDGPYIGEVNDNRMVALSGLGARLERVGRLSYTFLVSYTNYIQIFEGHQALYLYGDAAYSCRDWILCGYDNPSREEARFNHRMSSMRISVENAFGLTQNLWTKNAFGKGLKPLLQPVGCYYLTAVLLTNCYTCIQGNLIGKRFLLDPPSLHEYLVVN